MQITNVYFVENQDILSINVYPRKNLLIKKNKYHSKHLYYLNMSWDYESEYIVESKSEDKENDDRPVLVKKTLDRKKTMF